MTIAITVRSVSLHVAPPVETAQGVIAGRESFVITLETSDAVGMGEATPLAGWTESIDECRGALALRPW